MSDRFPCLVVRRGDLAVYAAEPDRGPYALVRGDDYAAVILREWRTPAQVMLGSRAIAVGTTRHGPDGEVPPRTMLLVRRGASWVPVYRLARATLDVCVDLPDVSPAKAARAVAWASAMRPGATPEAIAARAAERLGGA